MKKGQGLPLNTIIIAIIVLIVLVVVLAFFFGGIGGIQTRLSAQEMEQRLTTCKTWGFCDDTGRCDGDDVSELQPELGRWIDCGYVTGSLCCANSDGQSRYQTMLTDYRTGQSQ